MNKAALIDIILNDLKEIETLVNTFKGLEDIPSAFLNLTLSKVNHVSTEMVMLGDFSNNFKKEESKDIEVAIKSTPIVGKTSETNQPLDITAPKELETTNLIIEEHINTTSHSDELIEEPYTEVAKPEIQESTLEQEVKTERTIISKQDPKILGEQLNNEKTSVNDIIANKRESSASKSITGKPVSDIKQAIGINDRFFFQRELFNNSAELFNQIIDQLNAMPNFNAAQSFLTTNFDWDKNSEATTSFLAIVNRKFN